MRKVYYLMLVFSALLLGINFAINKQYQKSYGASLYAALFFNTLLGFSTTAIFLIFKGFKIGFSIYSCVMAAIEETLVICYTILGFKILKSLGSMAMYTLSLMSGGMVIPYILGIAFLNEPFTYLRTAGLILIIASVVLSNLSNLNSARKEIIMCVAVFLLNGCVSIVSKIHQTQTFYKTVSAFDFVAFGGMFKFFISGLIFLIVKGKNTQKNVHINNASKAIVIIAASAVASGVSFMLQLKGASKLPATVLYPFITGGSIMFSAVIGAFVFRERISFRLALSLAVCFVGTLFFI